jgi:hypothetical protein
MIVLGALLLALAIFLIVISWPFSFGYAFINAFVILGVGIVSLGSLVLLTFGIIFTNKYNSKKYLDKKVKK